MAQKKLYFSGRSKARGYTLIGVMLLLVSMLTMGLLRFRQQMFELETVRAQNEGKRLKTLNDAVEAYLVAHAGPLRSMSDNDCGGAAGCAPVTVYCAPLGATGNQCELDLARLVAENFLAPGWLNETSWGASYRTVVTRVLKPNAPGAAAREWDYNLRAITVTSAPWLDASNATPMLGFLGMAVKAGGADLAMSVTSPTQVSGLARRAYNATFTTGTLVSWTGDSSMNPGINAIGLLAARAGFEAASANGMETLMKLDGSRAMSSDLKMGNLNITEARDAFIKSASGGGRNLAATLPTWVFKYSWRVMDGGTVQKPDCSAPSGGWTNPTTLTNPWDPVFTPNAANAGKARDRGEARILVMNDNLKDLKSLGYNSSDPITQPANDPYEATQKKGRALGAYTFYADDQGSSWKVYFRYWQNNTYNTATDPSKGEGIASVYCYYDNKVESSCADNGQCGAATAPGQMSADLSAPPAASSASAEQPLAVSGSLSAIPGGPTGGAADQLMTGP